MLNSILLFSGTGIRVQWKQKGYNNKIWFENVTVYKWRGKMQSNSLSHKEAKLS